MRKKGFTLVEVALFLALSGLLVAAVIIGTSRSISEKRYNDTVDNFVSYLEGLYASANYVSHGGSGDSGQAVYGKLVIMNTNAAGSTSFASYSIAADANIRGRNLPTDAKDALEILHPTITTEPDDDKVFISEETYIPSWGGRIQAQTSKDGEIQDKNQILLLLLRSPKTNMLTTYVYYPDTGINIDNTSTNLSAFLNQFSKSDANFCIDSDDRWAGGNERRFVKIHAGANNASGVELIGNEDKGGFCEN